MADHAPQANAHAVAAHMHAVGNLLERVINGINGRMTALENQVNAMPAIPQALQDIQQDIQQIRLDVQQLMNQQQEASLSHIRILNHLAPPDAPLSYPLGTDRNALRSLAHTKAEAVDITDAGAHAALTLLGVEDIPQDAIARRRRFFEYIGIYLY